MTNEEIDEQVLQWIGRGMSTAGHLQKEIFSRVEARPKPTNGRSQDELDMRAIDKSLQRLRRKNLIEHRNRAWHIVAPSKT